jgi:hypothetical protein
MFTAALEMAWAELGIGNWPERLEAIVLIAMYLGLLDLASKGSNA